MDIAVLGTGAVGRTLAGGMAGCGHAVVVGTRDPSATRARDGTPSFSDWMAQVGVGLATFAEAAAGAEVVVHATSGQHALATLRAAGDLDGKVVVDVSNPLDFSGGFPPRLSVCNDDSLGEQIQRVFPGARVVKTLNTVHAPLMVDPGSLAGGAHTMFVCGDDDGAKATVTRLLEQLGWTDVLDLGDIANARGMEMVLPLWTRTYRALGTGLFGFRVVR